MGRLADASFCYSSLDGWEQAGRLDAILDLTRPRLAAAGRTATSTGTCCVAEGAVDIMVEPELSLWDLAALVPIVTEAGGTFTDLQGRPGPGGGSAVATNGQASRGYPRAFEQPPDCPVCQAKPNSPHAALPRTGSILSGWHLRVGSSSRAMIAAYGVANLLQSSPPPAPTCTTGLDPSCCCGWPGTRPT